MKSPETTRLYFAIGGFDSGASEIELQPSGQLRIGGTGSQPTDTPQLLEIPPERWQAFWRDVEAIGVWNWKKEYYRMVLDGTHWQLELSHAGRTLHSTGSNAYPKSDGEADAELEYPTAGQFDRFLTALRTLAQIPIPF